MLEPLHACNLSLHRLRADPRIRRHDAPPAFGRPVPGGGGRVRRADRERLRRRAADLSRRSRRWSQSLVAPAQARLPLHQRRAAGEEARAASGPAAGCSSTSTSTAWKPRTTGWSSAQGVFAAAVRGILGRQGRRLPGLHQHDDLPRHRHARNRRAVRLSYELGVDGLHDLAGLRLRGGLRGRSRRAPSRSS